MKRVTRFDHRHFHYILQMGCTQAKKATKPSKKAKTFVNVDVLSSPTTCTSDPAQERLKKEITRQIMNKRDQVTPLLRLQNNLLYRNRSKAWAGK